MLSWIEDGYLDPVSTALENDLVSSACVLSLTSLPELAINVPAAAAYPAVRSAPKIDCMIAPPRSRWRSAVPDAMPTRRTGTEPVSECEAGVPASPTPIPTKAQATPRRHA